MPKFSWQRFKENRLQIFRHWRFALFHPVQYILSERLRKAVNLVGDVVWADISEEEEVPSKRLWHKVEMTYERQGWDMIVILTPHSSDDNKFVRIFISGEWVEPTPE